MAERSHTMQHVRQLPGLGGQFLRCSFEICFTVAGILWLAPAAAPFALATALISVFLPLAALPVMMERDLRVRSHAGALSRFYLDALLGLVAVRTHGAERAVRREHESLLAEWSRSGFGLQRTVICVEALQFLAGFGLAAWLLFDHLGRGGGAGALLLLVYWSLNLPVLGEEIALTSRQYPALRNATMRLLEPLGALEEKDSDGGVAHDSHSASLGSERNTRGVSLSLENVTVRAGGHTILEDICLRVHAGCHVAIVGASGAGKSSLVGILLGWHRPSSGAVVVDGDPMDGRLQKQLRRETAWVDPTVRLWNRSFLRNLMYGAEESNSPGNAIEWADLHSLVQRLPDGLQTPLGEGGGLVSGGEGQRVRLGRAMLRRGARLVILDEPFRGLDREKRRELMLRARRHWPESTVLCITHDISETLGFDRVLVIDAGRIAEDGHPSDLAKVPGSRYRSMLDADTAVRKDLWSGADWRRLWIENGRLVEVQNKTKRA
jgi:ATP-binding cassette subfamily B protein